MQTLLHHSNKVQGVESLYFEDAQILKFKHDRISYASAGPLSVLYFKEYDRFVLKLNDWKFPLIKRLPILGMDHNKTGLKTYILPSANGFLYKLTIDHSTPQAMLNFESILRSNSCFAIKGEEAPFTKINDSPNDRLTRKKNKDTGPVEIIEQTFKAGVEKAKIAGKTLATGTLGLTSRAQRLDLKTIRNKNFKKKAHSSFNQDFFDQARKDTQDFLDKRENNINLVQTQPLYHLKRGPDLPVISIFREDIEASILDHKDLASLGHFNLGKQIPVTFKTVPEEQTTPKRQQAHEAKGFFEVLKQGLLEIKDTFSGLLLGTAGNNYMEQQEVREFEPPVDISPKEKPEQQEEQPHRRPSIGDRIKSGVNEFIQDVSLAWHDSADNLKDKPELQQREPTEMRDPALDETNQNLLLPGGVKNWEGLTHYQGENIKGVAVLSFPQVELEKSKSRDPHKTTTLGTLNVFYFSHYQLFVLQLHDWKYALLPNIMVTACKRSDKQGYVYTVPTQDGYHHLKIDTMVLNTAIRNFETVLSRSTDFYYVTNGVKYKPSPRPVQRSASTGSKQFFGNESPTGSGDGPGFERKRDKFKRTLKNIAEKFGRKTKVEESENLNMTQIRTYESIKGTTKAMAPVIRFNKNEIEETIINGNNIVRSLNPNISPSKTNHLNQGITPIKHQPIIMLQDFPDPDRIQIKTSAPPKDFKAAVNARADAIAQQIVNMHLNNKNPSQPQPMPNYALLKKDLSIIEEKSDEATSYSDSGNGNGNGNTKDEKEIRVSDINLSSRILSRQLTPEDFSQIMNSRPAPSEIREGENNGFKMSFSNGFPSTSIDEGYKNTNIESLPITIRHSEG